MRWPSNTFCTSRTFSRRLRPHRRSTLCSRAIPRRGPRRASCRRRTAWRRACRLCSRPCVMLETHSAGRCLSFDRVRVQSPPQSLLPHRKSSMRFPPLCLSVSKPLAVWHLQRVVMSEGGQIAAVDRMEIGPFSWYWTARSTRSPRCCTSSRTKRWHTTSCQSRMMADTGTPTRETTTGRSQGRCSSLSRILSGSSIGICTLRI
mmetsp:Transcript_3562/g.10984  ORF Transcript_3562/g.10984 Transcript_3562/m.10984 type:complete len:204 (-) Transcript_3562:1527-2138(-)